MRSSPAQRAARLRSRSACRPACSRLSVPRRAWAPFAAPAAAIPQLGALAGSAPGVSGASVSAVAPGAGTAGFAGTHGTVASSSPAGLTPLVSDEFGASARTPMLPATWDVQSVVAAGYPAS
ncbi:hypothetical protein [Mycobacterium ostraviense]|uniref:PPW family C-terminal domain-containing PPE protein n=1 Tax=Mycobacterium ostraviense TaxID=2738409 RepID=UPI0022772CC7|nr:hypothetical protein [Mycobacterium ostraviense]